MTMPLPYPPPDIRRRIRTARIDFEAWLDKAPLAIDTRSHANRCLMSIKSLEWNRHPSPAMLAGALADFMKLEQMFGK